MATLSDHEKIIAITELKTLLRSATALRTGADHLEQQAAQNRFQADMIEEHTQVVARSLGVRL